MHQKLVLWGMKRYLYKYYFIILKNSLFPFLPLALLPFSLHFLTVSLLSTFPSFLPFLLPFISPSFPRSYIGNEKVLVHVYLYNNKKMTVPLSHSLFPSFLYSFLPLFFLSFLP